MFNLKMTPRYLIDFKIPCRVSRSSMSVLILVLLIAIISNKGLCNGVEYFLDEDEHGSMETSKVPKIPPEIRVLAKHGEFHKTIYDLPNTETVLRETHFQLDIYDFAHWNDTHHSNGWERSHNGKIDPEEYHPAETTDIYLECTSVYPVEWVYEGDGWDIGRGIRTDRIANAHKIRSRNLRVTEEFKNKTTTLYFAQIGYLSLYEIATGNYTCRSLIDPRLATYFYLYMPVNSRSNDGGEIPRRTFVLDTQQIIRFPENVFLDDYIRLPCSVSDPTAKISLLKKQRDGKYIDVTRNESIFFIPSQGFLINFREVKNPWGSYLCQDETTKSTLQVVLLPRKDDEVQAFPSETHAYLNPFTNDHIDRPADTFECHAKRKILLSFDFDTKEVPVKIEYKFVGADEFPYKAIAKVPVSSQQQLKKEWGIVRCQTADTLRTLHLWEYSHQVGHTALELHYDNLNHQYLCCASNTIQPPKFQMVFCGDSLECKIRRGFHVTSQNAYSTKHFAPEGCASIPVNIEGFGELRRAITKWPAPVVEGLLQCTVGFPGFEEKKEASFVHNELTGYIHLTDTNEVVPPDEVPSGQSVMGIRQEGAPHDHLIGNIYVGDHIKFHCYAPSKYFSVGPTFFVTEAAHPPPFHIYQWAIMKRNGHIKYISSESCFYETCEITFGDRDTVGVVCFAPIRNSFEDVRNFTLPISVKERPKILKTSVVIRSPQGIEKFITSDHNASVILDEKTLGKNFQHDQNSVLLICSAPYHVQWKYGPGNGSPFVSSHNRRDALSLKVVYSYNYTSVIEFSKLDEMTTGRYTCFGTEEPKELNSYYDIFVPGLQLFMSESNKIVNVYGEHDEEKVDSVIIPCPVSDPSASVTLYTVHPENNSWVPANINPGLSFDPILGFRQRDGTIGDLLGYYYCGDSLGRTSGLITIENGRHIPEPEGLYYPEWPSKRLRQLQWNYTETFHCAAKENVTFVAVGAGIIPETTVFQSNKSSKFPYVATFTADLRDFLDFSIIQCLTVSDPPKVLHSWTVYKDGHFENRKFYYNESASSYVCCKGVFEPSPMDFVPCSSYQECKINKACLSDRRCEELGPAGSFAASYVNPKHKSLVADLKKKGCVVFDTEHNPSGLLQCNEEQYFFFLGNHAECDYQCSAFNEFRYLPAIQNSDILGITQTPRGPIQVWGKPVRFDCYGPRFQYAGGFKWALVKNNGALDFIPGNEKEEGALMHSWTEVQFVDKKVKSIACIAPETNTLTDWKKAVLDIEYDD
ncbi:unnamed protein product [Orchesella dallaii]|uniref:Uncharacterized protein n=1 Tax=Orchesella dallaii TaxID=48710 RepID=A0ABP1QBW1_9HEXA